jgi:hypothetical protein
MSLDAYARVAKHAGLNDSGGVVEALAAIEDDPATAGATLRRHHLVQLVRTVATDDGLRSRLPAPLVDALLAQRPEQSVEATVLLDVFGEVRDALDRAGIPVLLLKGPALSARLYGDLHRRPYRDVDLLVRGKHVAMAMETLQALGFVPRRRDYHSQTLARDAVQVDLHWSLHGMPACAPVEDSVWATACHVRVGGAQVVTTSDDYTVTLLALATLEDIGYGMVKLKQLLDLYLLLRAVDGAHGWDRFFTERRAENLDRVTANVLAMVSEVFEADSELLDLRAAIDAFDAEMGVHRRDDVAALLDHGRLRARNWAWFARVYPGSLLWFWLTSQLAKRRSS